jgi:Mg-chelatase subunit ChlD
MFIFIALKKRKMSLAQIREELHQRIDLADEHLLMMVYDVMTEVDLEEEEEEEDAELAQAIAKHDQDGPWKQMTEEELMEELKESIAEADRGEYISIEDLEKEMEEW